MNKVIDHKDIPNKREPVTRIGSLDTRTTMEYRTPQWMRFLCSPGHITNQSIHQRNICSLSHCNTTSNDFVAEVVANTCLSSWFYALFHAILTFITLLLMGAVFRCRSDHLTHMVKFPVHNLRWILSMCLCTLQLAALAEGVLTNQTSSRGLSFLYVPSICGFLSSISVTALYHFMEVYQKHSPVLLTSLYLALSFIFEVFRLKRFVDSFDFSIMQFDLVCGLLITYAALLCISVHHTFCFLKTLFGPGFRYNLISDTEDKNAYLDTFFISDYVSLPSQVTFSWLAELLQFGYGKQLALEDLGCLPVEHQAAWNHRNLKENIDLELSTASESDKLPLIKAVWNRSWKVLVISGLCNLMADTCFFLIPVGIKAVIIYVEGLDKGTGEKETFHFVTYEEFFSNGFVQLFILFAAATVRKLFYWLHAYLLVVESVHIKNALQAEIYEKCLHLEMHQSGGHTGQITNFMFIDAENIALAIKRIHVWVYIILVFPAFILLYYTIGTPTVFAMLVYVILMPIVMVSSRLISFFQKRVLVFTDARVKHTLELLRGIKVLKLNAWEELIHKTLSPLRLKEIKEICFKNCTASASTLSSNATPVLMAAICFSSYPFLTGKQLSSEVAFSALALLSIFDTLIFSMVEILPAIAMGYVSALRIQQFLRSFMDDPTDDQQFGANTKKRDLATDVITNEIVIWEISECDFSWSKMDPVPVLKDINVEIESGKLTVVVGPVGSGKSAFLYSLLGEMTFVRGKFKSHFLKPTTAFSAQKAWIQNATLRDNILSGIPLDKPRYDEVLSACALEPDIQLLGAGDLTELGERGINLSGGQKQRINVARALYSWSQVVLLDDPFSALDAHVSKHLFENGIIGLLKRRQRTTVLITNETQYLRYADKVIVLRGGAITHQGTYETITRADEQLALQWSEGQRRDHDEDQESNEAQIELQKMRKQQERYERFAKEEATGKLVEAEEVARGSVLLSVYLFLVKSSSWLLIGVMMSYGLENGLILGQHLWMAFWLKDNYHPIDMMEFNNTNDYESFRTSGFIVGYCSLAAATIFVTFLTQVGFVTTAVVLGLTLHKKMMMNVFKLPMRFFDTNPVGRILNRFSSDLEMIDMKMFRTMDACLYSSWRLSFTFIGVMIIQPSFTFVVIIFLISFFLVQNFYLKTSRQLRRLESVSKSDIYSHVTETIDGLSTIRAYRYQRRFFATFLERLDVNAAAYLYLHTSSNWLNLRLDFLSAFAGLIAGLITVLTADSLHPALVGFAISYAFKDVGRIGYIIRHISDMEIQMNAVERVKHYVCLPTEDLRGTPPPDDWPRHGAIAFDDVSVQYAEDTGPVLRDVNLTFNPREKIGICGRTGSGKSTLALSLFRCNEVCKGTIWIDGIDIYDVPLTTLRQRLSIIPQEPCLFMGSIRTNLDPEGTRSDEDLWDALEVVQLRDKIVQLDGALDAIVYGGGDNFSIGQQQLLCLARAYLRRSKVLIMDEPTASVDKETGKVLQDLLQSAFVTRTVLSIAHRVNTIMDSHSIVVMDGGRVVEFDTPQNLIAKEDGFFSSIYKSAEI